MKNLNIYLAVWMLLALIVVVLALYRKFITAHEEDRYVHLSQGEARLIPHQVDINRRISTIDRFGESLTILTLLGGLLIGAAYFYFAL